MLFQRTQVQRIDATPIPEGDAYVWSFSAGGYPG